IRTMAADGQTNTVAISPVQGSDDVEVDAANNVYVHNNGYGTLRRYAPNGTNTLLYDRFDALIRCFDADANGNVYFVDAGYGQLKKVAANGTVTTLASGFGRPNGIAVDGSGNVFVAISGKVLKLAAGETTPVEISTGYGTIGGIAIDKEGRIYVADRTNEQIYRIDPTGGYHSDYLPDGLTINETTGVISGTPIAIGASVLKNYTITAYNGADKTSTTLGIAGKSQNADLANLQLSKGSLSPGFAKATTSYNVHVDNTITTIMVTPFNDDPTATVKVNATSVTSGTASLPINLNVGDNTITVIVTASESNTKTYTLTVNRDGPIETTYPTTTQTYALNVPITPLVPAGTRFVSPPGFGLPSTVWKGGLGSGFDLAVDTANNVYIAGGSQPLRKISPDGQTVTVIDAQINSSSVTIDKLGNIYTLYESPALVKMYSSNGTFIKNITPALDRPVSIAVDAKQNLYIADFGTNRIIKILAGSNTVVPVYSGSDIRYIEADAEGNVFYLQGRSIYKIPANGGATVTLASGIDALSSIALDASGKVYYSNSYDKFIAMLPGNGRPAVLVASNLQNLAGIVIDNYGNTLS
ncbi:MAG: hypothetical protein EOP54_21370, partial [Sphingobacteriales bacterium]